MDRVLLAAAVSLAALTVPASPAAAQDFAAGSAFSNGPSAPSGPFVSSPSTGPRLFGDRHGFTRDFACGVRHRRDHGGDGDRRRRHRGVDCVVFAGPGYTQDFDGNRSFDPDRWNDWWHERPWRAYPRWVQEKRETCDPERMWWSGGGWHC